MNRRGFLTGTALAAATSLLPKATIFLPPAGGWPTVARYTHRTVALGFPIGNWDDQDYYAVLGAAYSRALAASIRETTRALEGSILQELLGDVFKGPQHG